MIRKCVDKKVCSFGGSPRTPHQGLYSWTSQTLDLPTNNFWIRHCAAILHHSVLYLPTNANPGDASLLHESPRPDAVAIQSRRMMAMPTAGSFIKSPTLVNSGDTLTLPVIRQLSVH